jgi:hypothetical protein
VIAPEGMVVCGDGIQRIKVKLAADTEVLE